MWRYPFYPISVSKLRRPSFENRFEMTAPLSRVAAFDRPRITAARQLTGKKLEPACHCCHHPSIHPCPTHSVREESRRERERETWSDLGSQSPRSKIPREEGGLEPSVDLRSSFPSLRSVNPRRSRYVDSADCGVIQGHRETLPDKWQGKGSS